MLAKFIHLDRIPFDKREWPPEVRGADRLLAVLREQMQDALLYRTLATLRRDVPLTETLEDLRYRGVPKERMAAFRDATGWARL